MGSKRFYSPNFSLFIVKFKKLGFSAPFNIPNLVVIQNVLLKWSFRCLLIEVP